MALKKLFSKKLIIQAIESIKTNCCEVITKFKKTFKEYPLASLIVTSALIAAFLAIGFYIHKFKIGYYEKPEEWGALGDFFGGILNPFFTFLSIILFAYTLSQNRKALEQSAKSLQQNQKALEINTEELTVSSKALESSAEAQHTQAISNNFFNLLAQHNNIVNNLYIDLDELQSINNNYSNPAIKGHNVFPSLIKLLSEETEAEDIWLTYTIIQNKHNHILGHYFRNLFQIIKYIDEYSDLETEVPKTSKERLAQKKNFMRILRAQLSSDELSLLLLNSIPRVVDSGQFRDLLVKYEMLKHIQFKDISSDRKTISLSTFKISTPDFNCYFKSSEESAFGENKFAIKTKKIIDVD